MPAPLCAHSSHRAHQVHNRLAPHATAVLLSQPMSLLSPLRSTGNLWQIRKRKEAVSAVSSLPFILSFILFLISFVFYSCSCTIHSLSSLQIVYTRSLLTLLPLSPHLSDSHSALLECSLSAGLPLVSFALGTLLCTSTGELRAALSALFGTLSASGTLSAVPK